MPARWRWPAGREGDCRAGPASRKLVCRAICGLPATAAIGIALAYPRGPNPRPRGAFGIIKQAMGWRQMSIRVLDKAQGEWSLVAMAWNVKRLHVLRAA